MRQILIADNDVIVGIFCTLQENNINHFRLTMQHLSSMYYEMWIPFEVEREFINHPIERNNRKRILEKIYNKYQFVKQCPITVSINEINFENNSSDEDRGETDAILQSQKATAIPDNRLRFSEIHLFFRDKGAIKRASEKNLSILQYKTFAIQLREIGVILP